MITNKPLYIQALEGLRKREMLFRILIFSLVTVAFWIGFNIYLSQQQTKLSIDIRKHTEPLNPNINRDTLTELLNRKAYTSQELETYPLYERISNEDGSSQLIIAGTKAEIEPPTVTADQTPPEFIASSSAQPIEISASSSAQPTTATSSAQ